MKNLFEPVTIGGLHLPNRVIRSATFEGAADADGRFAEKLGPIYTALAEGGVGTIITGMVGVDEKAGIGPTMVPAYGPHFTAELRSVAGQVKIGGAKLIVQIAHCGQKAWPVGDGQPLGPSAAGAARAMTKSEIAAVVDAFAEAAARCREAGADGVQLHVAHGYLLSQFLNPYFNKRDDEYGGDIEGRSRIVFEVYDAVRSKVGPDYPIWIKINGQDLTSPGISEEEFIQLGVRLAERGVDAFEVSGGAAVDAKSSSAQAIKSETDEGCFAAMALALAAKIGPKVISVCGYRTAEIMTQWLNKGDLAALSLCRPLISEPSLINRWRAGDLSRARCVSCNKCFKPKDGFGCQVF